MSNHKNVNALTAGGVLISLGIVFGDIGTSPLYTLNAIFTTILGGKQDINPTNVLGVLSCIIWTLTLQTTIKYVIITLRADNKGEGGIFSLFSLVRKKAKWLVVPAVVGGCALLADGIITPSITVTSAIEGLTNKFDIQVIPIVLTILTILFIIQQFGTNLVGKLFGPVMFVWFAVLGVLGMSFIVKDFTILKAFNPYYAIHLLVTNKLAFLILGGVFLCTTGAEALYSDLGHCGRNNIRISWIFVKLTLILNYLGQGVWILQNSGSYVPGAKMNPFFQIVPDQFQIPMVILATMAAVIASQALISGSFTLIAEAVRLNLWPKIKIVYPSVSKGQLYVPSINWMLWIGCCGIVLLFQKAEKMDAAYGLSITIAMLMTTILVSFYLRSRRFPKYLVAIFFFTYVIIEGTFLISNLTKFLHGGWVTVLIGSLLFTVMWSWFVARKIKNRFVKYVEIEDYYEILTELSGDESVPKYSSQLVYLTSANFKTEIESKIIYSIIQKEPKRADVYWLVHVDVMDEPYTLDYKVEFLIPGKLIRIDFRLGFRIEQRVNLLYRKVVEELVKNGEIDITSQYTSLNKHKIAGDFRFVLLEKHLSKFTKLSFYERQIMDYYFILKKLSLSEERSFGLDSSYVDVEKVPLIFVTPDDIELNRLPV
ncbi:Low affinity potassium transport system protein kup [Pedobacter sp. Bi27]|uniref:KUP/HAK/KT family potassium transporter n=1 Tax=unclassified Pedobacter TaxID=2628915 RepID=UPI001DAFE22E|nr:MULTISPECIES: KUP/HAK/KT family potassium transporter [unclassified Pedobacter]CAH0315776.1 Low affinity potassium transport system protein kup [Pedobacter sp. Bi36]CAH0319540.1 Low affinity potassium transport system protein kup [Pedobacter sp. Bi27]CAH0320147.1 Low affinity potassium transport system protein kup [Pedobacter sp. Bi126]